MTDFIVPIGRVRRKITRADGRIEEAIIPNIVTAIGLNTMASRTISDTSSPFAFLAIGTETDQHSLGSNNIGEVDRKAAATATFSNETLILVASWAGNADSLTGVDLRSASIANSVNSGQGIFLNAINSVATILQDSDFLLLQAEVQVGSHNLIV